MSTWLITGCSTGFGRAIAGAVLAAGHNAVITARDVDSVADLAQGHPDTALAVALDVTDQTQVAAAVERAELHFGAIDVLVNNAGYGYRGAIEEGDDADIERLFATNLFGPISMIKAVLPGMRARHSGAILNVSSIGARISLAGSGYYAATKAALDAVSTALAKEVAPLGISVTAVVPGSFRTDFAGRSLAESATVIHDYDDTAGRRRKANDRSDGNQPGDPDKAARLIIDAVEADVTPTLLLLGRDAVQAFDRVAADEQDQIQAWRDYSAATNF